MRGVIIYKQGVEKRSRHNPKSNLIFFDLPRLERQLPPQGSPKGNFPLNCFWWLCQWLQITTCDNLSCCNQVNLWELQRNFLAFSWKNPTQSLLFPCHWPRRSPLPCPVWGGPQPWARRVRPSCTFWQLAFFSIGADPGSKRWKKV